MKPPPQDSDSRQRKQTIFVGMASQLDVQGAASGLPGGKDTWKVAFSGDCRPCNAVVTNAKDADLLIHEVRVGSGCHAHAAGVRLLILVWSCERWEHGS